VCFDEWGPLELKPIGGVAWAQQRRPHRRRATYHRLQGTEHFLGFYDVHRDCLDGVFSKRKRIDDLTVAFKQLRRCYQNQRLFVVLDNLHGTHDHPRFLQLLKRLHITPVFTPTQASWLNLIEAQFGVLSRFTLRDTDDASHQARRRRIYRYLRWRHRRVNTDNHRLSRVRQMRISNIKLEQH
jgi:transposase